MKKLSKILKESVWGGILDRGTGETIRKEDDVNLLDIDGLFNYVEEKYSDKVCRIDSDIIYGFQGWKNCVVFPFDDDLEITITRFLDTGKIRDIVIMWDKNGVQDSFIRKLNDRFNICFAPRENAYIDIKDKDGSVSNQTYIDLLDFVLENERTDVLIESVWGGILDRGAGDTIRKEDDVDTLSPEDFFDYLKNNYKVDNSSWDMTNNTNSSTISIPFACTQIKSQHHIFALFFDYNENVVYISNNNQKYTPNLWSKLDKEFDLWKDEPDYEGYTIINPLDTNRHINNSYVLEVIDFIIDNMDGIFDFIKRNLDCHVVKTISKKTNESVWGNVLDRGAGDTIRKEDDIISYNGQQMVEYIINNYRINDNSSKPRYYDVDDTLDVPVIIWKDIKDTRMYHTNIVFYDYDNNVIYVAASTYEDTLKKIKSNPEFSTFKYEIDYLAITPKKGDVNNKFLIKVIDFIIDNVDDKAIPVLSKRYVNESVWGGVLDRGAGDTIRKEDDINNLDFNEFFKYIKDTYRITEPSGFFEIGHYRTPGTDTENISIPFEKNDNHATPNLSNRMFIIRYDIRKNEYLSLNPNMYFFRLYPNEMRKTFEDKYELDGTQLSITPKDGKITNNVCIDVINRLISIVENPLISKNIKESIWGGVLDRGVGDDVRREEGKIVQQLEIDGVLYKFTDKFWVMGDEFNEENSDEWTCFAFDKPKNGSSIISEYGEEFGAFGLDDSDISEKEYDVYVIKDYFDRDKFLETLLENGGDLKEFHGPREITDILWNYTKKILDDNHMSEYAHHRIFDIANSDVNETFGIYAVTNKEYLDIPEDENFTKDDITDGHVISFPILGDENNPWAETLTRELIESYQKLGWKQVESYELDPWGGWAHYEDALMFVKFKEGFVPREPEYEDDDEYRDY